MSRTSLGMLTLLRVALGYVFFHAGLTKLFTAGGWSAAGYLRGATGPFASFFQSLAGVAWVDTLNAWGLTLIGAALILGVLVRWSSFWGIVLMLLYYFAHFEQNTANGFLDEHIMYALILLFFIATGAGKWYGLDGRLRVAPRFRAWMLSGS